MRYGSSAQFLTVVLQPASNTSPSIAMFVFLKFWCVQRLDNQAGNEGVLATEGNISEGDLNLMAMWGAGTKSFSAAAPRLNNDASKLCKCLGYQLMLGPRKKTAFWTSVTDIGNTQSRIFQDHNKIFSAYWIFFSIKLWFVWVAPQCLSSNQPAAMQTFGVCSGLCGCCLDLQ